MNGEKVDMSEVYGIGELDLEDVEGGMKEAECSFYTKVNDLHPHSKERYEKDNVIWESLDVLYSSRNAKRIARNLLIQISHVPPTPS